MQVCHLIDSHPDSATPMTLALLDDLVGAMTGVSSTVCVVGRRAAQMAQSVGMDQYAMLKVAGSNPLLAVRAWRQYVRENGPFDLVHAWSLRSLALGLVATPRARCVATLTFPPRRIQKWWWLRRLVRRRSTVLFPISRTVERALLAAGWDAGRISVIEPGLNPVRQSSATRDVQRLAWGAADPDTVLVGLLGDPPTAADAWRGLLIVDLLSETGRSARLVYHPAAHGAQRARRAAERVGHGDRIIFEPAMGRPWRVLGACDVALMLQTAYGQAAAASGTWPTAADGAAALLWAMASGVPIVGPDCGVASQWLEDGRSACLAPPASTRQLAHAMGRLCQEPGLGRPLAAAARRIVETDFTSSQYAVRQLQAYEQHLAGRPIEVDQPGSYPDDRAAQIA